METNLKSLKLPKTLSITFQILVDRLERSEFKNELTDTTKEVMKQFVSDGVNERDAIKIVENCLGYRLVGIQGHGETYYFLKND